MKRKWIKPLSLVLCGALIIGGTGAVAFALGSDKKEEPISEQSVSASEEDADIVKDETVYVLAGADGSVQKIIVSDWIKNAIGSETVTDKSELTDVENVKGEESYTMNGDNMRVWDAKGNDIYCQGNIEKELPVGLSVSYKLDGKSISPTELAGKSGKVTIRFDYQNKQFETVEIDGKQEKIYVPFAMLTGMLFDNDVFTDVEVTNGKLINDGDRIAVVGIAFPGLQDNLNLDEDKLTIPDYVEITAQVKNFEMTNTVTIATNEIFNRLNTDKLNSIDDLTDSLDELNDAMGQLMDGSSQLYDGLCTLLDKSGELVDGINKLTTGAEQLKTGAGDLKTGAAALADGAQELSDGLGELTANNDTLNAGSKQVFESLLSMANSQLSAAGLSVPTLTIQNYAEVLNGVIASLDETNVANQAQETARKTVTEAVNAQKDAITAGVTAKVQEGVTEKVTAAVRDNVESQVLGAMGMTKEQYDTGVSEGTIGEEQQAQVAAAIAAQMDVETVKATIAANVDGTMKSADTQALIASETEKQMALLIEQNMNSPEVQAKITEALEAAKSGAASISALKEQLDSYNTFYIGLGQYTSGVASAKGGADQLNAGAVQLKAGTAELYAGMSELYDGILTLKDGAPALISGVTELRDGAMKLSDGLKEFNREGVQKLISVVDGDIGGLITRFKATADVSKDYKSFSGISDEMDGQVKFIYRTEAVETKAE
ncbi:MAG: hypothetical protein ACOYKJ_05420 [Candidatus Howiella sp.]|jgi:putative membrane protein